MALTKDKEDLLNNITEERIARWEAVADILLNGTEAELTEKQKALLTNLTDERIARWETAADIILNGTTPSEEAVVINEEQKILLKNLTPDRIARWEDAAFKAHLHDNKNTLDKVTSTILSAQVEGGSGANDVLVYNTSTGQYEAMSLAEFRQLVAIKVTSAEQTTLEGIWGTNEKGLQIYNTDLDAIYVWNGSAFQ